MDHNEHLFCGTFHHSCGSWCCLAEPQHFCLWNEALWFVLFLKITLRMYLFFFLFQMLEMGETHGVSESGKRAVPFAAQPEVLLSTVLFSTKGSHLTCADIQLLAVMSSGCCFFSFLFCSPPLFHTNTVLVYEPGSFSSCYSKALPLSRSGLSALCSIYLFGPLETNLPILSPGGESV